MYSRRQAGCIHSAGQSRNHLRRARMRSACASQGMISFHRFCQRSELLNSGSGSSIERRAFSLQRRAELNRILPRILFPNHRARLYAPCFRSEMCRRTSSGCPRCIEDRIQPDRPFRKTALAEQRLLDLPIWRGRRLQTDLPRCDKSLRSTCESPYIASGLSMPRSASERTSSRSATAAVASRNVFRAGSLSVKM
jgi:hypothetical protein